MHCYAQIVGELQKLKVDARDIEEILQLLQNEGFENEKQLLPQFERHADSTAVLKVLDLFCVLPANPELCRALVGSILGICRRMFGSQLNTTAVNSYSTFYGVHTPACV